MNLCPVDFVFQQRLVWPYSKNIGSLHAQGTSLELCGGLSVGLQNVWTAEYEDVGDPRGCG